MTTASEPIGSRHLNRALPGWAVDAIIFGLPDKDARDGRKVWGMCVRIAMSAHRRGWNESEYVVEITHEDKKRGPGRLWMQLTTRSDGRTRSGDSPYRALRKAWAAGVANANNVGMRSLEEIRDDAVELAYRWTDRLTDGLDGLSPTQAAVMGYVVAETERREMLRVTCPGRAVAEYAKVPHRTAARTLSSLAKLRLLIKHSPGRRGKDGKGKAAIYGLPDPDTLAHIHRGNTPMCHSTGSTPTTEAVERPASMNED